jgi:hypothetical protein
MMLRCLTAFLALLPSAAVAEDAPVLATFHADNCCLPPEFAWEITLTILADGTLTLQRCEGYETEGPGCTTHRARASVAALEGVRTAAIASGLSKDPASERADPLIGRGGTSGSVMLDGVEIDLPRDPSARDFHRVGLVLHAIRAAVPAELEQTFQD